MNCMTLLSNTDISVHGRVFSGLVESWVNMETKNIVFGGGRGGKHLFCYFNI